jgi:hypothetical protein
VLSRFQSYPYEHEGGPRKKPKNLPPFSVGPMTVLFFRLGYEIVRIINQINLKMSLETLDETDQNDRDKNIFFFCD